MTSGSTGPRWMTAEFTDDRTETYFAIGTQPAYVLCNKGEGIIHVLRVHNTEKSQYMINKYFMVVGNYLVLFAE